MSVFFLKCPARANQKKAADNLAAALGSFLFHMRKLP